MLLFTAVCSTTILAGAQQIDVAVCSLGSVPDSAIAQAKTEAELVYRSVGIAIVWHGCDGFPAPSEQLRSPWFVVRLRTDEPPVKVGAVSVDAMGKAFVEGHGRGSMADVYLQAIQATAEQYSGDFGVLLGFVMAHELGHLFLGPGHTRDGIMQAAWGKTQMNALRQRWLRFNRENGERIRWAIGAPAASNTGSVPGK
jgi:hypothetical protein